MSEIDIKQLLDGETPFYPQTDIHGLVNNGEYAIDNVPTIDSSNLVTSGGVASELAMSAVYDVTAHNGNAQFASLQALLTDPNINTLIPTNIRRGGMSIKFVSSNKYLQYRLMLSDFTAVQFTKAANWQGVDTEVIKNSYNLITGNAAYNANELVKLGIGDEIQGNREQYRINWDGTFDTSGGYHKEYEIPDSTSKVFLTGTFNSNTTYANYWILDNNRQILSKERFYAPVSYSLHEIILPEGAKYLYVYGSNSEINGQSEIYPPLKRVADFVNENTDNIEAIPYLKEAVTSRTLIDVSSQQGGRLKNNGSIYTSSSIIKKFSFPQGVTTVYLFGHQSVTPNGDWSAYWLVDANGNMLSSLPETEPMPQIHKNLKIEVGEAVQLWTNLSDYIVEYETGEILFSSHIERVATTASEQAQEASQGATAATAAARSIENVLKEGVDIYSVSSQTGVLKTDGTIYTETGTIFKFDLVNDVTEYYVTAQAGLTPSSGWCIYWLVDSNGNMLYGKEETNPNPQSYNGDLKIDTSIVSGVAQIWLQARPSKPHYLTYLLDKLIDVRGLKSQTEKNTEDIQAIGPNRNQWKNKKIVWMGTSIPAGQGISGQNYPTQIAASLACEVQNNAVSGLALEGNLSDGVWSPKPLGSASLTLAEYVAAGISSPGNKCYENNMLGKDADLYVFDCEPNNSNADTTILNDFDVNTWSYTGSLAGTTLADHRDCYVGCLLYLLDKLWTEKPDAKVVFVGEHTSCTDFARDYAMSAASAALAQKLRIPYIDLADKLYYNKFNVGVYVQNDKVHPTQAGHDRIAKILTNELLLIA